jgi:hypothetical protein
MFWILRTGARDLIGKYASPFLSLVRQRNMGITSGKIIMGRTKGEITFGRGCTLVCQPLQIVAEQLIQYLLAGYDSNEIVYRAQSQRL